MKRLFLSALLSLLLVFSIMPINVFAADRLSDSGAQFIAYGEEDTYAEYGEDSETTDDFFATNLDPNQRSDTDPGEAHLQQEGPITGFNGESDNTSKFLRAIIIGTAAICIIIIIVEIIITINKKRSAKKSNTNNTIPQMYNNNPNPQANGYYPQNNTNGNNFAARPIVNNQVIPEPVPAKKDETKYSVSKLNLTGICSMCKSENEQLYYITAVQNGETQTFVVCKKCAEQIIRNFSL